MSDKRTEGKEDSRATEIDNNDRKNRKISKQLTHHVNTSNKTVQNVACCPGFFHTLTAFLRVFFPIVVIIPLAEYIILFIKANVGLTRTATVQEIR